MGHGAFVFWSAQRMDPLLLASVVSHPCDSKKSQGWGTELLFSGRRKGWTLCFWPPWSPTLATVKGRKDGARSFCFLVGAALLLRLGPLVGGSRFGCGGSRLVESVGVTGCDER